MNRTPDFNAAVIKHQPQSRNIAMKNILDLFTFKKPLLSSTAIRPEPPVEAPEQQARHALIKLGNIALQNSLRLEPETAEYERQIELLCGYISLKQQLEKLTEGKSHA